MGSLHLSRRFGGIGRPGRPGAINRCQRLSLTNNQKMLFEVVGKYQSLTNFELPKMTTKNAGAASTATGVKSYLKATRLRAVDTMPEGMAASGEVAHV